MQCQKERRSTSEREGVGRGEGVVDTVAEFGGEGEEGEDGELAGSGAGSGGGHVR